MKMSCFSSSSTQPQLSIRINNQVLKCFDWIFYLYCIQNLIQFSLYCIKILYNFIYIVTKSYTTLYCIKILYNFIYIVSKSYTIFFILYQNLIQFINIVSKSYTILFILYPNLIQFSFSFVFVSFIWSMFQTWTVFCLGACWAGRISWNTTRHQCEICYCICIIFFLFLFSLITSYYVWGFDIHLF